MIHRSKLLLSCAAAMLLSLCALPICAQPPDTGPRVGEIDERRASDRSDARFQLDLRLFDRPPGTTRVHAQVARAMDDKGRDLTGLPQDVLPWDSFDQNEVAEAEWNGRNPARGAVQLKELSGVLEAFVPTRDADATLTLDDWRKFVGAPLVDAGALQANAIALRILSPAQYAALPRDEREAIDREVPEDSLLFVVSDPGRRLVGITFLNEAGRQIRAQDDSNDRAIVLRFNRALPASARLRLLIATPKATVQVPFKLSNIELP